MREAKKEKALPAATEDAPRRRNRRQAIALAGAAAAGAAVAALGMDRGKNAHAATDEPMILGRHNEADPGDTTELTTSFDGGSALLVTNPAEPEPGPGGTAIHGDGKASGLLGTSTFGWGVHGVAERAAGVCGQSGFPAWGPEFRLGAGIGVLGESGAGPGVEGRSESGLGVLGQSDTGPGVRGESLEGQGVGVSGHGQIGVMGRSGEPPPPEGDGKGGIPSAGVLGEAWGEGSAGVMAFAGEAGLLALRVVGKACFSTAGSGAVPARMSAATVANPAVTADSHITVTFTGDPGRASVAWVERQPGTGFVVHLSAWPRSDVPFTYLIVEPRWEPPAA